MSASGPYTDHPTQLAGIVFPNQSMQTLSSIIHLFGAVRMFYPCVLFRAPDDRRNIFLLADVVEYVLAQTMRTLGLLGFVSPLSDSLSARLIIQPSWLFLFATGILIGGAGMSSAFINCALGIYSCILLYAGSKVLIYCFLIEKVHIVWGGTHQPRLHSKVYLGCLITMLPYAAIVILMLIGRVAYFRDDRSCIIGLKAYASLSLLIYDLYINIFLTGMFLWPLFRSRLSNPKIKKMAMRTLAAAFAGLTTSTINIAVLTIMHGQQLGWVCLGSCGTDVTVNALVLFWVTDSVSQIGSENTHATNCLTVSPAAAIISNQSALEEGAKSPGRLAHEQVSTVIRRTGNSTASVVFGKPPGRRNKGLLGKIGDALRNRNDDQDDRMHQMSVQVTITTEQQGDIMLDDVNYTPRAVSVNESIGTSRMDLEKGEVDEEERRDIVVLPVKHGHEPYSSASRPGCPLVVVTFVELVSHSTSLAITSCISPSTRSLCSLSKVNGIGSSAITSRTITGIYPQYYDSVAPGSSTADSPAIEANGGKAKRGTIFKCETCSKVYRHPNCLVKHRWEHSPHWREASKFLLSKHQQVQMLEAAAILSHISPSRNGMGTSLPEDRSLWPAYLSGGLLPMPGMGTSAPVVPAAPPATAYREREASVSTSAVEDDEDVGESSDEREDSGYGSSSAALAVPGRPQPQPHQTYGIATSVGGHEYTLSSSHAGCDAGAHIGSMAYQYSIGRSMSASSFGVSSLRDRDEEEDETEGTADDHSHTHINGNGRKWEEDESMAMDMDL
ncbi:unnamed protein product [Rhizoctonia solani]|uniref:C2H2-type domain-containing protein n=1 Tax=Rhizoctonia solani TaxID=456999 RepID=A0A8H3HGF4_9AGAM|nr:unnamed protein product [Rhizoctonia solani]